MTFTLDIGDMIIPAKIYTMELIVGLDEYPNANARTEYFDIRFFGDIYPPADFQEEVVIYIGEPPRNVTFEPFWGEGINELLLMYNSTLEDGSDLPDLVVFDNYTRSYEITPDKESDYNITI